MAHPSSRTNFDGQFGKTDTLASQMAAAATSGTLSSGNFAAFTSDYLVLDYDNPSKREVILCNVSGTSITSATRAQQGTSDVTHSAGANVAYVWLPAHYDAIKSSTLGYAEATSNQGTFTAETDLTSLTVTVTVPSGARVRVFGRVCPSTSNGGDTIVTRIKESSTTLATAFQTVQTTGAAEHEDISCILTPSGGSHTYKLSMARNSGSGNITNNASSTNPSYILAEII